jgi:peptide deformylase
VNSAANAVGRWTPALRISKSEKAMQSLRLRIYPDPILREKAAPVDHFDDALREFAEAMLDTMQRERGIGLAAPQVGESRRLLVALQMRDPDDESADPIVLVNPRVVSMGGDMWAYEEGCLSIPGVSGTVNRREDIEVEYQDLDGNTQRLLASGMYARVLFHEIDHLNGKLFIDYLSTAQKSLIKSQLKKLAESSS